MTTVDSHTEHSVEGHAGEHDHPSEGKYIQIALILAVLTAIEVVLSYTEDQVGQRGTIALLLVFAAVKFFMVAMYFMHLKFDHPWFRRLFVTGLVLAAFCYIAYLATLNVWG